MTSVLRRLSPTGWVGLALVAAVFFIAALSALWTPYDPLAVAPGHRLEGSSMQHLLGTDRFGRDVLSRIMVGSQITLLVGVVSVGISALIGVPLGLWAALRKGGVNTAIMRGADLLLAFPALLLAILSGAIFGASTWSAMLAIGIAGIPGFIRVTRANALQVLTQDYIAAARIGGRSHTSIATVHVLPNIVSTLIVQASVAFALAVLAEAALSFLGLGTPPPDASWGRMLGDAQASLASAPHVAIWPGVAIALTVLGFNLLGDGLRDAFDPRRRTH
ncbi:ABC transporter permease [Corynebacterium lowii]|uniref:Glutathione transport system permease protein GsiD n=1 Tax=Corynebacterium lowii TaxID=1544413 RepID=A0A0Q0YJB4_9CORY|nr:ABC transporter permease [Corynebacterium lowii]KQB86901.1 Glutathione transport system permease protein GsiD [Corynebacterium lowii]MDP9851589.1 peptide/nickel transport system permease protein [Corynebacterium lowii]